MTPKQLLEISLAARKIESLARMLDSPYPLREQSIIDAAKEIEKIAKEEMSKR